MENTEDLEKREFVTKDMNLMEILTRYPEVAPILMGYGLHCVGCHFSNIDTLENGAKIHGMDDETLDMMLRDVNLIIEKFKRAEGGEIDLDPSENPNKS
jgi:hybrid cluster-associated redox disulfide protein